MARGGDRPFTLRRYLRAAWLRPEKVRVGAVEAVDNFRRRRGHEVAGAQTIAYILGAYLVESHVDEVINVFALAIRNGLTAGDLAMTIFAYPTGAPDIRFMIGNE